MRRSDLPAVWTVASKAVKTPESGCTTAFASRFAAAPVFAHGTDQLSSVAFVYGRLGLARAALARLRSPKQQRCFERHLLVRLRKAAPNAVLHAEAVSKPATADGAFGFTVAFTAKGVRTKLHYDIVSLRRGRIVCELVVVGRTKRSRAPFVRRITAVLARRATAARSG